LNAHAHKRLISFKDFKCNFAMLLKFSSCLCGCYYACYISCNAAVFPSKAV